MTNFAIKRNFRFLASRIFGCLTLQQRWGAGWGGPTYLSEGDGFSYAPDTKCAGFQQKITMKTEEL